MKADLPPAIKARLDPAERYGLRLTLVGVAIVLVAIPFATLTFEVIGRGPLARADGRVANTMNDWVHGRVGMVPTLQAISFMGRPPFLAVWVLIVAVVMWRSDRHRIAIFLVVTSLGGGFVDTAVKAAVNRPRPVVDHPVATALGKSFPSGHAMSATVTYGALLVALWPLIPDRFRRPAFAATVLLVLAIGSSRLLLGVHFVSDVVGGYVLGLAWLAGAVAAFGTWTVEERRAEIRERRREKTGHPDAPSMPGRDPLRHA
jgi:undecaprenyl-diphosphatase